MNKKYLSVVLFGALLLGTAGTFTSCKDYDDDIENLQGQITAMKGTVDQLEQKIKDGLVVTKVEKVADGVSITFSNGQTFKLENGAKGDKGDTGATGAAGKDADVWTIDKDGYWCKNGDRTEYVAVPSVTSGTDGRTLFYKPNTETECFDLWEIVDGKEQKVKETDISYVAKSGLSVVHNGNKLIITGAKDKDGNAVAPVELMLGEKLASIAFVPEFLDQYSKYPITKFYHIEKYLSEDKYITTGTLADTKWDFDPQSKYDKSNEVKMTYRVNPNGAYLQDVVLSFINRKITTTKTVDGDMANLMNRVAGTEVISEETITTNATLNASQRKEANAWTDPATFDLVAMQAAVGAVAPITSDYTAVRSEEIVPILVDTKLTTAANPVEFKTRYKSVGENNVNEDDEFIKHYVGAVNTPNPATPALFPAHLKFAHKDAAGNPGQIDLKEKVALYGKKADGTALGYLKDLGFTGIRYAFHLPKEYNAPGTGNLTNQQWYVSLNEETGILSVNKDHLNTGSFAPAIGRRPVVRVDAFMKNNAGTEKLVASCYIRLEIVESLLQGENNIVLNEQDITYQNLDGTYTTINGMTHDQIATAIYGVEDLNANNFWANYKTNYSVVVNTYKKSDGSKLELLNQTFAADTEVDDATIPGIRLGIWMNATNVTSSYIKFSVNNEVLTQNTYKDMDKGAKYEVTITIDPIDPAQHRKFIITQVFNVKDECKFFTLNPNYSQAGTNLVTVKGNTFDIDPSHPTLGQTWKLQSYLPEHFEMINIGTTATPDWQNIFGYYKENASPVPNIANTANNLTFKWNNATPVALPATITETSPDMMVRLKDEIEDDEVTKQMDYTFKLVNGESCTTSYDVKFVNPFKSGNIHGVSLYDRGSEQTAETASEVVLIAKRENAEVLKWFNDADHTPARLDLTALGSTTYKVAMPTITYKWVEDTVYTRLKNNLTSDSKLECELGTGKITWLNRGTALVSEHKLTVEATVTFTGLCIVKVRIPVTILPI